MGSSESKTFVRKTSNKWKIANVIENEPTVVRHYFEKECDFDSLLQSAESEIISLPEDVSLEGPRDREISRFRLVGKVNVALQLCSRCRDAGKPFMMDTYYIDREEVAQIRTILCEGCIGYYLMVLSDRCGLLLNDTMH